MLLQIQAEIQERLAQHPGVAQQQGYEQPAHAPVAVEEGVDGLELHVRESRLQQRGLLLRMEETLERRHAPGHLGVRGRHEDGVSRAGPSDPVLREPELAGGSFAAPPARHQHAVDLADQAVRQRKPLPQPAQTVFEGGHVVRDFAHVVERNPRRLLHLEEQEVGQRRLRSFDLGRKHCFLAYVGVQEQLLVRQKLCDALEATQCEHRRLQGLLQPNGWPPNTCSRSAVTATAGPNWNRP